MLDEPCDTNSHSIGFIIACIRLLAHILLQAFSNLLFGRLCISCDRELDRRGGNLFEHALIFMPCADIRHTDNLAENLRLGGKMVEASFPDIDNRILRHDFITCEIGALLLGNLCEHLAVWFL